MMRFKTIERARPTMASHVALASLAAVLIGATACGDDEGGGTDTAATSGGAGGGGEGGGSSPGGGEPLDRFVAVELTSLEASSPMRRLSLVSPTSGEIIMSSTRIVDDEQQSRPEAWMVFADGVVLHLSTSGAGAAPAETTLTWGGHTLRVLHPDGETVTEAVYVAPSGEEMRSAASDLGSAADALTIAELEQEVDGVIGHFLQIRHHPIVNELHERAEPVRQLLTSFDGLRDAIEHPSAYVHRLFVPEPVGADWEPSDPVLTMQIVVDEAHQRADGQTPSTDLLPDEVSRQIAETEDLEEARWEAPRVPCIQEYREGSILGVVQHACVASTEVCEAAGGSPFERRDDCNSWCSGSDAMPPEMASHDPSTGELACYLNECVTEFLPSGTTVPPLWDDECCEAGISGEYCGGEAPGDGVVDSADECEAAWAPELFGHTWRVTQAIRTHADENGNPLEVDIMVQTEGFSSYYRDWTFEITADGRVREVYTVFEQFNGTWEERTVDIWEYNPHLETDPVEDHFVFGFDESYKMAANDPGEPLCKYSYFMHTESIAGGTLTGYRNDYIYALRPTRFTLTR